MAYDDMTVSGPVEGEEEPPEQGRDGVGDMPITEAPDEAEQPAADYFKDLREHNSNASLRLSEVQKVRYSEMAEDLNQARLQAYIEANFGTQALKLLQAVVPLIAGLV